MNPVVVIALPQVFPSSMVDGAEIYCCNVPVIPILIVLGIKGTFQGMADTPLKLWYEGSSYPTTNTSAGMLSSVGSVKGSKPNNTVYDETYSSSYVRFTFAKTYADEAGFLRRLSNVMYLNAYLTLTIKVSTSRTGGSGVSRLGFSTSGSMTGNSFTAAITFAVEINQGIYTLNVASLTGPVYMYLWQTASGWYSSSRDDWGSYTTSYSIYEISLT